jgi:thiamine transport system permease protein
LYKTYFLVLGFLTLVIILPILGIISKIEFDFSYFIRFFNSSYNIRLIYISFIQAFTSATISCIIAILFALSLYRHKNLTIIKVIITLCGYSFVLPSILVVFSVIGIFGINGFLNNITNFYEIFNIESIFGLKAIIIGHVLLNAPFATRLFLQNLNTISKNYVDVSTSLRLGFVSNIIKIEWPILKQNFLSIFSIIFVLCFLSFAIVMSLGGGPSTSTIEVAIYQLVLFDLNFNEAIILSIFQIFICIIFLITGFYKQRGSNFFEIQTDIYIHPFKDIFLIKIIDFILIFFISIFLFSPIIYVLSNFFPLIYEENILLKNYFINALLNSLVLCIFTAIYVTFIGLISSILLVKIRKQYFLQQTLFLVSSIILIISPVIISMGYFIILGELRYVYWITIIVIININCIFLLPFSILILFTKLKNIFLNFEDIKESFRINDISFIKLIYPLIKKNLLYVFSFSAAIAFGDFTVISFFKNDSFHTLPSLLYKLITSYRFTEASIVAGLILILSLFIYLIFDNKIVYEDIPDKKI